MKTPACVTGEFYHPPRYKSYHKPGFESYQA